MDGRLALSLFALVVCLVSLAYSIIRARKTRARYREMKKQLAAEEQAWIDRQLQSWRDGELEARLEPALSGDGEHYVIEPTPGHKIVVGSTGKGKAYVDCGVAKSSPEDFGFSEDVRFVVSRGGQESTKLFSFCEVMEFLDACSIADNEVLLASVFAGVPFEIDGASMQFTAVNCAVGRALNSPG